jgi:uncharacterized protein (TIGR02996 family)
MADVRAALLQAVCENPDDDTPRLVYADWLDDHGDPDRAEFIRLQVALAAGSVPDSERAAAEAGVAELLARYQTAWWDELPHRSGVMWMSVPVPFVRGFATGVLFHDDKSWKKYAGEVFAASPITSLGFSSLIPMRTGRSLLSSPLLGRITDLKPPPIDRRGAEALITNPRLTGRLRTLRITDHTTDVEVVVTVLGQAPGLRNVESLSFLGAGPADVAALAGSPSLARLKALHLNHCQAGDDGATTLASPHLSALESLSVSGAGPAGVAALAGSPNLTRLKSLYLNGSQAGDDGATALAGSPYLPALEILLLNDGGVGDPGATALARSDQLTALRELYLGGNNPITGAGAQAVASSTGLPRLAELHLWETRVGEAGARALADFAEQRGLRVLNLRGCPIPAPVFRAIAQRLGSRFLM